MKTVRETLKDKGFEIWSTTPDAMVYDALKEMADKNVGALLVLDGEDLVGIFSERDYARKVILKGKSSKELAVREIMTRNPLCVPPDRTMQECMQLMTARRVRHLPVMEEDRLIGVISIGDVVKNIIEDQEVTIGQLEDYITGRR